MGTGEIWGRISDGLDGDHRAESEKQTDYRQSAARANADKCCRSCQSASRESQPHSIRQAETRLRSIQRTVDGRAGKAKKTRECPRIRRLDRVPAKADTTRHLPRLFAWRDLASAEN